MRLVLPIAQESFFCLIHTVLGFDLEESKCFLKIQQQIGVTKLFTNLNYIDTESDSFDAVKTSVDCILRLISPQYSHKEWSRYKHFCDSMEQIGEKNQAFAQRDKRFGGAAAAAAVVNFHWDHLKQHLAPAMSQVSDRNQLACGVQSLLNSDVVQFFIVAKAIVGFHLHEPFINSIVEQNITRTDLLIVLPALYVELLNPPRDVLKLTVPALPCLTSSWSGESYPLNQVNALKSYTDLCDKTAMTKLVKQLFKEDANCLARQRGPEYGFGGTANIDHPQNVCNQLQPDKQQLLNTVPADNLESKHYFGDFTYRLAKAGSRYVDHVSECMTISGSSDIAFSDHKWQSKEFSNVFKEMKKSSKVFEEKQKKLRELDIESQEGIDDKFAAGRKKAAVILKLKGHGGPITCIEDIDSILEKYPMWESLPDKDESVKSLKKLLCQEITYARDYAFDNLKRTGNPLFKLNKLSLREMVGNLSVLYGSRQDTLTADIEDVRVALHTLFDPSEDMVGEQESGPSIRLIEKDTGIVFSVDDKLHLAVVDNVDRDTISVIPLEKVETDMSDQEFHVRRYPDMLNVLNIKQENVLPVFPQLELDKMCSKNMFDGQVIILHLLNDDIIKLFTSR